MAGSPRLPLKYRRKGGLDYHVHCSDLDVSFRSYGYGCTSEYSLPQSPTTYSSSSSVAPSSPIRSLCTPEPSSPIPEPRIASSPKSPKFNGRRGFWEVAVNYGPDFPYKARPTVQASNFAREQFITRRRGSSASAPTLVSDAELSEYSEDTDPFHADDDVTDEESVPTVPNTVTIVNAKDEPALDERQIWRSPQDDIVHPTNNEEILNGDIDVAAVLLDLRRQVRFDRVGSRPEDIAFNPKASHSLDLAQHPSSVTNQSCRMDQETTTLKSETDTTSIICESVPDKDINSSVLKRWEDQVHLVHEGVYPETSNSTFGISAIIAEDQYCSIEGRACPVPQTVPLGIDISSENIATGSTTETMEVTQASNKQASVDEMESCAITGEACKDDERPIVVPDFSDALTPLSSPVLSDSGLSELTELLSGPYSPIHDWEFTGPTDDTRHPREANVVPSRYSSPVPGPSNIRSAVSDQRGGSTNVQPRNCSKKGRARSVHNAKATESDQNWDTIIKKRGRSVSAIESSPTSSASCPDILKPRKKRAKRTDATTVSSRSQDGSETTKPADDSSSQLPTCSISPHPENTSSSPRDLKADIVGGDADLRSELCGCLIQAMALSRASSMPASSLLREVLRENPHMANQHSKPDWFNLISLVLGSNNVFGRIDRKGFDADDKPLEAQWFYIPEKDPDQDRATLLREMMPKKRNETKKHKQYFFKPLGKISRWDPEDAL